MALGVRALLMLALACGCARPAAEPPPSPVAPIVDETGKLERPPQAAPEATQDERDIAPIHAFQAPPDAAPAQHPVERTTGAHDVLVGLTRAQLRARRGEPSERSAHEWVYTPDQPGCQELIVSEVVSFAGDVVSAVRLRRARTHKRCKESAF